MAVDLTDPERPCPALWRNTHGQLEPLGCHSLTIAPDLADATGSNGRVNLSASAWAVGPRNEPIAECRLVCIVSPSAEVFNAMIFSHRPEALPLYAAEVLFFGGRPRLTFVDLQAPGLAPAVIAATGVRTRLILDRYPGIPQELTAPAWAVEYSPGGHFLTRSTDPAHATPILEICAEYLAAWVELARVVPKGETTASAHDAVRHYKTHHTANSPGPEFLGKMFGAEWTRRFLCDFLYR